jgi:hypothetical protein
MYVCGHLVYFSCLGTYFVPRKYGKPVADLGKAEDSTLGI